MPLAVMLPFIVLGNIVLCLIVQLLQRFLPVVLFGPLLKSLVLVSGAVLITGLPFHTALLMGANQLVTAVAGTMLAYSALVYLPIHRHAGNTKFESKVV